MDRADLLGRRRRVDPVDLALVPSKLVAVDLDVVLRLVLPAVPLPGIPGDESREPFLAFSLLDGLDHGREVIEDPEVVLSEVRDLSGLLVREEPAHEVDVVVATEIGRESSRA